jgi:hypothetical protein
VDFYLSITQDKLLNEDLKFASEYTTILESDKEIIDHAKKTLLFHDNSPWNKTNIPINLTSPWVHMTEQKHVSL